MTGSGTESLRVAIAEREAENRINCGDGCGNSVEKPSVVGWTWLTVLRRWRCPACVKTLDEVNHEQSDA